MDVGKIKFIFFKENGKEFHREAVKSVIDKEIIIESKAELNFSYKGNTYSVTNNPYKELHLDLGSYKYCYRMRCLERLNYFLKTKDYTFLNMEIERQIREGDLVRL